MLTFKLAYRNLFRNTRRTVLTALLISLSLTALIWTDGMIKGMISLMIDGITRTFQGQMQVHHQDFREAFDADLYIADTSEIEATLNAEPTVAAFAMRTMAGGMIASTRNTSGGMIVGVDPEQERALSKIATSMVEGEYFSNKASNILIGDNLADLLEVKLGDRIVLTVAQVDGGDLSQGLFRLSGVFDLGIRELDSNLVFITIDKSRELLGMRHGVHEVAILFESPFDGTEATALQSRLSQNGNEALNWIELNPAIGTMLEMVRYSTVMIGAVLFLLAALGIINSMFMSIYERIYEFGVALAIGTQPRQLVGLILTEAFLLAVFSVVLGALLGAVLNYLTSIYGIPMGEIEFEGMNMSSMLRTQLSWDQFTLFPAVVILLTMIAALYPARFAARIIPAIALQRTL